MFRNPLFNEVLTLGETVDRLFNEDLMGGNFRTLWSRKDGTTTWTSPMPVDVYGTADNVVILASVPGMQPEHLDLSIHNNTVTLSGKVQSTTQSEETKGATWYAQELWSGDVRRSITLPFPVDADAAEAVFENGILRVTLPKAESAKPRKIQISAGAQPQTAIEAGSQSSS